MRHHLFLSLVKQFSAPLQTGRLLRGVVLVVLFEYNRLSNLDLLRQQSITINYLY